ncbi:orotidine-5'-phosphate decarboxylase [Acidipropionibacterium jensenii]|uniref:orotidine-5'-phosphate decarboxylase n=1 Tax=Acidipropionibacterium jensenii TaxID=1749 RepID=UPI000BC2F0D2|nr:orotidine-5'-phosphate decarboxylase [Acidipropionibacterium jensenii]AZZ41996.1 orotidine-5'-phosphate decarboxylase [Acidipropionibacterium jensenii]
MDTSRPIIALDLPSADQALALVSRFGDEKLFLKVGMELFYASGPGIVGQLKDAGHDVFCDLKLHDIPNTVKRAAASLAGLGADLLTVHAAGGRAMMEAAVEGLSAASNDPSVVAITQLTSTSEEAMHTEQLIEVPLAESVVHYAQLAQSAGLAGVVCSAWEAAGIGEATGESFLRVTPGIRPTGTAVGDQARVATPEKAHSMGSSAIVVGRPITRAEDPVAAYHAIRKAWNSGQQS